MYERFCELVKHGTSLPYRMLHTAFAIDYQTHASKKT